MKKYFVECSFGLVGMKSTHVIQAANESLAREEARLLAIENAESFGFYQDEDFFGDLDSVGREWMEDEENYGEAGFLDYSVTEYNPETHDMYLY